MQTLAVKDIGELGKSAWRQVCARVFNVTILARAELDAQDLN